MTPINRLLSLLNIQMERKTEMIKTVKKAKVRFLTNRQRRMTSERRESVTRLTNSSTIYSKIFSCFVNGKRMRKREEALTRANLEYFGYIGEF